MQTLRIGTLRALTVADTSQGGAREHHLSAASGLALIGARAFVVADDEHALAMFELDHDRPGTLLPVFADGLPPQPAARKAAKADLESLTVLPAFEGHPHGALFAAGSGSRPNRQRGVLIGLDAHGGVAGPALALDLSALYAPLRARFAQLNVEGMFLDAGALCLLQRGNKAACINACVRFDWPDVARWLGGGPAPAPNTIRGHDLGTLDGVPLSFTDGAPWPGGGWIFSAAAEDTADSYLDGACAGSVVGLVGARGEIERIDRVASPLKVEGIAAVRDASGTMLWMVTDADDRRVPASLLSAHWPQQPDERSAPR